MKRSIIILYVCLLALTGGCRFSLESDRHDAERLLLIQTMGLDSWEGGVEMSVSSGLGEEDAPALVMSTPATGIEDAIARLQNYSPENQLFYAHVQYLLLGEGAAQRELANVIQWADRSPTLRMDTDMLVVKGLARDAVVNASGQATDITQRLASMDRQARSMGWTIYSLRQAAAALAEGDGALCLAVETVPTDGKVFTEQSRTDAVVPSGYAMLGRDGLAGFLDPERSLGAELIVGDPAGLLITVGGCTLELLECSARIEGIDGADGSPAGVWLRCAVQAGLLETSGEAPAPEELDRALSETVGAWIAGAVAAAQEAGCDCLGIRRAVLSSAGDMAAWGGAWETIFPELDVTVTVDGQVERNYDLAE